MDHYFCCGDSLSACLVTRCQQRRRYGRKARRPTGESPVQGVITTPEETGCDIDPEDQVSSDEIIYAAMMIDFLDRGSDIIINSPNRIRNWPTTVF